MEAGVLLVVMVNVSSTMETRPEPLGTNSMFPFELVAAISFSDMSKFEPDAPLL